MTSFLHLDLDDYEEEENVKKQTEICMCCTSETNVFVNMKTCKHTAFLQNNLKYKLDLKNMCKHLCVMCHDMLVKIEAFKQQVEDSISLLLDQGPILKVNKLHNLQRGPITINDSLEPETTFDVKVEIKEETDVALQDNTDIKLEYMSSDYDAGPEVTVVPTKKTYKRGKRRSKYDNKYDGKVKVVIMNEKELMEERDSSARTDSYLRLPFKCTDCVMGFDHERTFANHIQKRHTKMKRSHQCNICKSYLGTKMSFNEHMKRHFKRWECMVCGRRFHHLMSAIQHYDEQHATPGTSIQGDLTCKLCGFVTTSNRIYRYHMDKHRNKQDCKICGNTFVNNNGLKVHMYMVHGESSRVYSCSICDKSYRTKSGLSAHTRSHGPATHSAYCALCRTHFKTEQGLLHHMSTHSKHISESDKRFICDECGARFVKKSNLQIHINWEHLKVQVHRCNECNKVFKSGPALRRHINYVHNKKRPPRNKICDYCGRAFTTHTILLSHIRTHTGERPLQCPQCPATFAHSAALYTHNKLLHTNNK